MRMRLRGRGRSIRRIRRIRNIKRRMGITRRDPEADLRARVVTRINFLFSETGDMETSRRVL